MDTAVALVQAYLRMNGYFTVTEYPVLDVTAHAPARMIVGEVKEGKPRLNAAMRDPAVLEPRSPDSLRNGRVVAPAGHVIRTVAFRNPQHPRLEPRTDGEVTSRVAEPGRSEVRTSRQRKPSPSRGTFGPIRQRTNAELSTHGGHADGRGPIVEMVPALPSIPAGS